MVDGVQSTWKITTKTQPTSDRLFAFFCHKLYAPKGIGMFYVHKDAPFTPLLAGGGQEGSLRSGTENVSGIAALGAVMEALTDGKTFRDHATLHHF